MQCEYCGGNVEWQGPLSNLTHTKCLNCGKINCQIINEEASQDEEFEETSPLPPVKCQCASECLKCKCLK